MTSVRHKRAFTRQNISSRRMPITARFLCGGASKAAVLQTDAGYATPFMRQARPHARSLGLRKHTGGRVSHHQRLSPARIIGYARAFDAFRQPPAYGLHAAFFDRTKEAKTHVATLTKIRPGY
jgi:hypothetical protein